MWALSRKSQRQSKQQSFVGGKPYLPPGTAIPTCRHCCKPQTFFFQVAIPSRAFWGGRTLACFACTRCCDEDHLIPEMLDCHLQGCDIPAGFLNLYQRNFAFLVFSSEAARLVDDYQEQIAFSAVKLRRSASIGDFGKIGGTPNWIMQDESPATYASTVRMEYLMELPLGLQFPIVNSAPRQVTVDMLGNPTLSQGNHYTLFIGNAIYFFGTSEGDPLVYAVTQVD